MLRRTSKADIPKLRSWSEKMLYVWAAQVCKLPAWLTETVCCFKNTGLWSAGQRTAGGPDNLIPSLCLTRLPNPFCSTSRVRFRVRRARCNRKPVTQSRTLNASHTYYWEACWMKQHCLCGAVPPHEFKDNTGRVDRKRGQAKQVSLVLSVPL